MREILFRGKCKNSGEWVVGDFCHPCNICYETIGYDEQLKQDNVPIWNDEAVAPETVGQYTGLTDKNGKKIFDGDIVRYDNGTGYIAWSDYNAAWMCVEEKGEYREWFSNMSEIEIIGNIYDNPELLEEVK